MIGRIGTKFSSGVTDDGNLSTTVMRCIMTVADRIRLCEAKHSHLNEGVFIPDGGKNCLRGLCDFLLPWGFT